MLLGQLDILLQPRAEPGLLLLFDVVCMCGGVGDVVLLLEAACPSSRLSLLFLISPPAGAGRAWVSNPLPLPRSSGCPGWSYTFPHHHHPLFFFPADAGLRFSWSFRHPKRGKYGAPQRIQEIGCVWQSKDFCNSGVCQPVLADLLILQ